MKKLLRISTLACLVFLISGCTTVQQFDIPNSEEPSKNLLKTTKDLEIERALVGGIWVYERQSDDCKNTNWEHSFHANRYYKSTGEACSVLDAFNVDAENWYIKDKTLYASNLTLVDDDDIILRYVVTYLDNKKLILNRGEYRYTFVRK